MDLEALREVLGQEAYEDMAELQRLRQMLEEAGLLPQSGNGMQLTQGNGRSAPKRCVTSLRDEEKPVRQPSGHLAWGLRRPHGRTKTYEFGDPFQLDIGQTLKNAVIRQYKGVPVEVDPVDFEVYRTELLTRSSTVIMVDLSPAGALRLQSFHRRQESRPGAGELIRTQFPRDKLYIVGFGDYAREVKLGDLPYLTVGPEHTNTQEGLELSRKLLSRRVARTSKSSWSRTAGLRRRASMVDCSFIHGVCIPPSLEETYLAESAVDAAKSPSTPSCGG